MNEDQNKELQDPGQGSAGSDLNNVSYTGGNGAGMNLSKSQKLAAGALAFFAVFILVFWIVDLKNSISTPPATTGGGRGGSQQQLDRTAGTCPGGQCGQESDTDLKSVDSDGDGLSDWQELEKYNTSPYLEDSDSDGFTDKEEVESGNDPNCPSGSECDTSGLKESETDRKASEQNTQTTPEQTTGQPDDNLSIDPGAMDEGQMQKLMEGSGDAESLRQMLKEAGVKESMLDQFSDEELMQSYREVMQGQ